MSAVGGSMELSVLNATAGDVLREHPAYAAIVVLVLLGAFSKSAQFPLHFWLPNAMEAPTPVSAYLHSSTMVKAGVYLLARLSPALGGTELWFYALVIFGTATMLTGGILALRQTDLKLVLAYTTVAGLGTLVMLIGLGEPLAFKAAATFLITHALYKGALFMSAGAIDHEAGTRNPLELGGLARAMPISFAAAALAGLSMAGIIPFVGFIAKEVMYEATLHFGPTGGAILSACTILGNAFNVTAAGIVVVRPFLGPDKALPKHPHEAPLSLYLGPAVLAVTGLAAGALHPVTSDLFVAPMMTSLAGAAPAGHAADLYLWHGFKTPLFLSLATLAIGVVMYLGWHTVRHGIADALHWLGWGPDRGYDQFVSGMERVAFTQVRYQQTGYMRHYLIASFLALVGFVVLTLGLFGGWPGGFAMPVVRLSEAVALVLLLGGAIVATMVFSRIAAIAAVGTVGYAVALIFVMFSAPDLAFTQFLVETLTVVILVMVLMRVPLEVRSMRTRFCRRRDAAIAIAVGATVSLLLMSTVQGELDLRLTEFFVNASVPEAHGHNVVNVILVDFRALDTLGEIFVVTMAGLSTLGLVRLARARHRRRGEGEAS
jgi:multicomponent Na+:H+ antiporter subunit A